MNIIEIMLTFPNGIAHDLNLLHVSEILYLFKHIESH